MTKKLVNNYFGQKDNFLGKSATWVYSSSRHILERVIQSGSWANLLHGYTAVLGVYWNELFNQVQSWLISISNSAIIYTTFELIVCTLYICYKHGYTFSKNGDLLKLPFRSKLIHFIRFFLKLTYFIINASNEGICVEFWRKKEYNLGLPTFKLPTSTKHRLRLTR